jgi:hypothetical protein
LVSDPDAAAEAARAFALEYGETKRMTDIVEALNLVTLTCEEAGLEELPEDWQEIVLELLPSSNESESLKGEGAPKEDTPSDKETFTRYLIQKERDGTFTYTLPNIVREMKRGPEDVEPYGRIQNHLNALKALFRKTFTKDPAVKTAEDMLTEILTSDTRIGLTTRAACQIIFDADSKYLKLPPPILIDHLFSLPGRVKLPKNIPTANSFVKSLGAKVNHNTMTKVIKENLIPGLDYYTKNKKVLVTPRGQLLLKNAIQNASGKRIGLNTLHTSLQEILTEEVSLHHLLAHIKLTPELGYFLVSFLRDPKTKSFIEKCSNLGEIEDLITNRLAKYQYDGVFDQKKTQETIPQLQNLIKLVTYSLRFEEQSKLFKLLAGSRKTFKHPGLHALNRFFQITDNLPDQEKCLINSQLLNLLSSFKDKH